MGLVWHYAHVVLWMKERVWEWVKRVQGLTDNERGMLNLDFKVNGFTK